MVGKVAVGGKFKTPVLESLEKCGKSSRENRNNCKRAGASKAC